MSISELPLKSVQNIIEILAAVQDNIWVPEVSAVFKLTSIRGLEEQFHQIRKDLQRQGATFESLVPWVTGVHKADLLFENQVYEYYLLDKTRLKTLLVIYKAFGEDTDLWKVEHFEDWYILGPDVFSSGRPDFREWMLRSWLSTNPWCMLVSARPSLERLWSRMAGLPRTS